jgi:mRNA interferase MazF
MSYKRGDVILVRYPSSDLRTYKKRPAFIVQSDDISTGVPQRIVALITSNLSRTGATRVPIQKDSDVGQQMGLLKDSVVVADNLATVVDREVDRKIGACPVMDRVDAALRRALGL